MGCCEASLPVQHGLAAALTSLVGLALHWFCFEGVLLLGVWRQGGLLGRSGSGFGSLGKEGRREGECVEDGAFW